MGEAVGVGLTFQKAALALIIGNAVLISIVILTGLLAYKNGLSTAFLSRKVFGKSSSNIFSILLALSAVTWISLNGYLSCSFRYRTNNRNTDKYSLLCNPTYAHR
ncbi:MAG: cytosine permease [Peptococcaceae bacterium]